MNDDIFSAARVGGSAPQNPAPASAPLSAGSGSGDIFGAARAGAGGAASPGTSRPLIGMPASAAQTGDRANPQYWFSRGLTPPDSVEYNKNNTQAKRERTQVARTLNAVYAPLSPTGPLVGSSIQDAQIGYMPFTGPHMGKMAGDFGDTVSKQRNPAGVVKGIEEAQHNYGLLDVGGLNEERRQGGAIGTVADAALHHPRITGALAAGAELLNPTGGVLGLAAKPFAMAARASGLAGKAGDVGRTLADMNPLDRYAPVRAGAGEAGENLAHTMESRIRAGGNAAMEPTINAFGDPRASAGNIKSFDPDKMVEGLTRAEQLEVQNRAYELPEKSPYTKYAPNRSLDASVLKRTGVSLDDRAKALRAYQRDVDARMVQHGVMDKDDLYESGTFSPMKQFRDRPVFSEQFMNAHGIDPNNPNVPLSAIGAPRNITPGASGSGQISRAFARGTKTQPPNYLLPEDALHPDYLPAHQIYEHYNAAEQAIEQARALKLAEQTNVENLANPGMPAQPARVTKQYQRNAFGQVFNVGEGAEGRNAATNLVNRQRRYQAQVQAANEMGRPDLLGKSRSPFKSIAFLSALQRGRTAGLGDLERAYTAVDPERISGAVNFEKIASGLDDFQQRLVKADDNIGAAVRENGTLREALASTVASQRNAAKAVLDELGELREAVAQQRPGNVRSVAGQMREGAENAQQPYWDALQQVGGKMVPDMVWDNAKKRYVPAGAFADIARSLLKHPAGSELRSIGDRAPGNIDQITDIIRQTHPNITDDDVRDFFKKNPRPPSTSQFTDDARERILSEILPKYQNAGADQIEALRDELRAARTDTKVAEARQRGADAATRTLAAPIAAARTTIARGTGAAGPLQNMAGKLRQAKGDVFGSVQRARATIGDIGERVTIELDDLADKLLSARADEQARQAIEARTRKLLESNVRSVAEEVDQEWGKLPKGYTPEEQLRLGARDSNAYGLKDEIGHLLAEPLTDPRGRNTAQKFDGFMRGMTTLNNLTRTGIIAIPTVHVIGNLGAQFLAKYKDFPAFARVLAGKTNVKPADADFMREAGAVPGSMGDLQGVYEHGPAEVMTRNRSELPRAARLDQYVSQKYWSPNQKLVFGHFEEGYAWEAMQKELKRTPEGRAELASHTVGPASMRAAREIRKFAGDYQNISGTERKLGLNQLMYFYPWLKTAVAFWAKHGILDPKSTIVAPTRGVQVNNEIEGYDDPNEPFTATTGREEDGAFRRTTLPYAGRIMEDIGRTAMLPFDAAAYPWTGPDRTLGDAKSPFKMLRNRLNPVGAGIDAGMENVGGQLVHRAELPGTTAADRIGAVGAAAGDQFAGPFSRVLQASTDPAGAAIGLATGAFSYEQPVNISRGDLAKYMQLVQLYREQGNNQAADEILQQLKAIQSPQ